MDKKFLFKKDIFVILILVVISLAVYFIYKNYFMEKAATAQIVYDNNVIEEVSLSEDRIFSPEGFPNIVFEIKDGKIAFIESDCPDKICINTGFLSLSGQTAVCLPNKMVLKLVNDNNDDVDSIS